MSRCEFKRKPGIDATMITGDFLDRARVLIEHAIRRRWAEGLITRDADGVFTAFLGANEVEKLLKPVADPQGIVGDHTYDPDEPLGILARRLALGPSELDLLAVLLACETDPRMSKLVTYLGGNQSQLTMTFELLLDIVYKPRLERHAEAAAAMFHDLAPSRLLRRLRYVLVDGGTARVALAQGVRLDGRVIAWLLGNLELDPELVPFCRRFEPLDWPPALPDPELVEPVVAAFGVKRRLIDMQGPRQSGRELVLRHAAASLGRPLLVVEGRGLGADRVVVAFREASLSGALLAFTDGDDVLAGDGLVAFRNCLGTIDDSVAMIGCRDSVRTLATMRPTTTVQVAVPPFERRLALWETHLGPDAALSRVELERIAAMYNLGVAGIVNASTMAHELATFAQKRTDRSHIGRAIRNLFDSDLSTVARRVEVRQSWDDLVVPDEIARSVSSILDRIPYRGRVLGDWGFAKKVGKGLGLTVLFSGEPGTGKSMVAGLIAAELGLELYVVDLSQISSKWLGETEKNLARTFDAAEAGHVMLLFDEADSLFAKRTADVRSSNDRYANQETNFILARLEQFEGVAFFTTNLANAIDPAVARRMSLNIRFPFPDADTRETLWQRMMPAEAPVAADIDYRLLAQRYEVSGGIIRNIVLRAAYLAAHDGTKIEMAHLVAAAEMEYRDRGALASSGRLV
jgi:AAA+ superfamily predicted ATPase